MVSHEAGEAGRGQFVEALHVTVRDLDFFNKQLIRCTI